MPPLDKYITEEVPIITYTVTYTDGVDDEVIFEDQVTTDLSDGDATPAFNGTPARDGYTFKGWNPAVAETVSGDITYTAQWEKKDTSDPKDPTKPSFEKLQVMPLLTTRTLNLLMPRKHQKPAMKAI